MPSFISEEAFFPIERASDAAQESDPFVPLRGWLRLPSAILTLTARHPRVFYHHVFTSPIWHPWIVHFQFFTSPIGRVHDIGVRISFTGSKDKFCIAGLSAPTGPLATAL